MFHVYDRILEAIGGDELSLSICEALSMDDMNETLDYIANCFEIESEDE